VIESLESTLLNGEAFDRRFSSPATHKAQWQWPPMSAALHKFHSAAAKSLFHHRTGPCEAHPHNSTFVRHTVVFNFPPDRKRRAAFPSSNALRPRPAEFNRLCVNLLRFDSPTNKMCSQVELFITFCFAGEPPRHWQRLLDAAHWKVRFYFLFRIGLRCCMNAACGGCVCIRLLIWYALCMWPQQLDRCMRITIFLSPVD
jgi:hypothetical protein